jgi:hypothetical protein
MPRDAATSCPLMAGDEAGLEQEPIMEKSNQKPRQSEKASCACAEAKVERCGCGEDCNCSRACNRIGGCGCSEAKIARSREIFLGFLVVSWLSAEMVRGGSSWSETV